MAAEPLWYEKTLRLLNRITFGPRPADVERVCQMGLNTFLDQQLHSEKIDDSAIEGAAHRIMALAELVGAVSHGGARLPHALLWLGLERVLAAPVQAALADYI